MFALLTAGNRHTPLSTKRDHPSLATTEMSSSSMATGRTSTVGDAHAVFSPNRRQVVRSVPARLGKGQGAEEIGHNLARDRPKFGHNLVRQKIGHSLDFRAWTTKSGRAHFHVRTAKIWAQSSTRTKQDLGTMMWAIDENMGRNLQALYGSSADWKHKNRNYM